MPSVTSLPVQTPVPRFAATPAIRPAVRFGDQADTEPPKTGKPGSGLIDTLRQALSQQGIVRGIKDFAGTFGSLLAWNKALDAADSQSSFVSRFLAVFDIAAARFREALLAKGPDEPAGADKVNYILYGNVLASFPRLLLMEGQAPVDLAEKALAACPEPEKLKEGLAELRASYTPESQVSLDELKTRVWDALKAAAGKPEG